MFLVFTEKGARGNRMESVELRNAEELKALKKKTVKITFPHQLFQFNPLFSIEGPIWLANLYNGKLYIQQKV